ncbi:MAG: VCBS repeat-containing protein [Bryobacteraceae bacterium]
MRKFLHLVTLLTAASGLGLSQNPVPDFIGGATYATGGSSSLAAVADFNGDRLPDIVTVEAGTQTLSLLAGKPGGALSPPVSLNLGFPVTSIAAGDFNGDGKPDVALATATGVAVLLNTGAGAFAAPAFYSVGIVPSYVAAADLDHDGAPDLAVAGANGFAILRNLAGGGFSAPVVLPQISASSYLVLADFNNDGNIDLLGDAGLQGQFYAGLGDGTFLQPVATIAIPYGSSVADFNLDGKMDVATTVTQQRQHGSVQAISIAIGTGDGHFLGAFELVLTGAAIGQPVAADFNADGKPDVAIQRGTPGDIVVYLGMGDGTLQAAPSFDAAVSGGLLMAADTDGNGSKDLLLVTGPNLTVWRNTHGNPPLLAQTVLNPAWVLGGGTVTGSVTLGGPAPAAGALVRLSSSKPAVAVPSVTSVTIPAGSATATFAITTTAVNAATAVKIVGTWNGVKQPGTLNLVAPYSLTGLSLNPSSQFGIFSAQGLVTLSGPADANAVISLSSGNAAVASVPATVTVLAGSSTASFTIVLQPVAVDTVVPVTASIGGITLSSPLTILKPQDSLQITRAQYTARQAQFRVDATSTNATATLTAWNSDTGAAIGTLTNAGGGKYTGTFTVPAAVIRVTLKSSLGGTVTGAVTQK